MVIKGSDRSHDFKTRERKAPEVRSAPRAAARKAIRDKLEKQARDTAHNNYVNQPQEQNAPEAYGTEQVEALAQKAGDTTYATMKTASPKREAALRFKRREQTRKTAEQVQEYVDNITIDVQTTLIYKDREVDYIMTPITWLK